MQNVTDVTAERINIIAQQLRQRFIAATVDDIDVFRAIITVEGFAGRFVVNFEEVNLTNVIYLVHDGIKDSADFISTRSDFHAMQFIANVLEMAKQGH
jgi:hypothetical protein